MSVGSDFSHHSVKAAKQKSHRGVRRRQLFISFVALMLVLLVIYRASSHYQHTKKSLTTTPANQASRNTQSKKEKTVEDTIKTDANNAPAAIQPNYNFYQLLPRLHLMPTSQPIPLPTTDNVNFWLQIAASTDLPGIEQLQKKLQKNGYVAVIRTQHNTNNLTYRLIIGPYNKKGDAQWALKRLRAQRLDGYIFSQTPKNQTS